MRPEVSLQKQQNRKLINFLQNLLRRGVTLTLPFKTRNMRVLNDQLGHHVDKHGHESFWIM